MKRSVLIIAAVLCLLTVGTAFAQKPSLGVAEFKNETSAGWWSGGVGWELSGMLTNELAAMEKFKIVERNKLERVLGEQDLGASDRIAKGTAAKMGKVTGAQYLVFGTVTSYEEKVKGGGAGLSYRGIGIGGKKDDAYIAVDVRVVDTTTGEVEFVRTVEARSSGYGVGLGLYRGGFGGRLSQYEKTPAGKAIRAVLIEISEYLGCAMVDQDGCMDEYKQKEQSRRAKTKKSIKLD